MYEYCTGKIREMATTTEAIEFRDHKTIENWKPAAGSSSRERKSKSSFYVTLDPTIILLCDLRRKSVSTTFNNFQSRSLSPKKEFV